MNIYKLKNKELNKLCKEFNKTEFGKRANFLAMLPMWGAVVSLILMIVEDIINGNGNSFLCLAFLNVALFGITFLQYFNMLKDYVDSKKSKE